MPNIRKSMLHTLIVGTANLIDASVTAAKLAANALTPASVAVTPATGIGVTVTATFEIPNTAGDYDLVLPAKIEWADMTAVKTLGNGGAGDTVRLKNGANNLSNALSLNAVVGTIVWADSNDPAYNTVASGGTLRVTAAKATNCACHITVYGVVRA
jgi:hypothetical protein